MKKVNSGGGIASNKHVSIPVRVGGPARKVKPAGAAQFGRAQGAMRDGAKVTSRNSAEPVFCGPLPGVGSQKLGNEVAGNIGAGGPGAGRVVRRSGFQSPTPPVQPREQGRDTLAEFGPERSSPKGERR
jgi:hypothetical protein